MKKVSTAVCVKGRGHDVIASEPPIRDVVQVLDVKGPRGGWLLVLVLACGHWHTRKKLPATKRAPCVGCLVESAMKKRKKK